MKQGCKHYYIRIGIKFSYTLDQVSALMIKNN